MTTDRSQASREVVRGLIVAGLLLGVIFAIKLLTPAHLSPEVAQRLVGVLMGAVVVFYANGVPKALTPLMQMRGDPVREQAIRRFTGWSIAVGGAGFALAWAVAPLASARVLAASFLGVSVLLVVARLAWARASGSRA